MSTNTDVAKGAYRRLKRSTEVDIEGAKLDFAMELRRLMDQNEFKNSDLADVLGVSRPMVTKLLRGDANVTIETMVKASKALGGKLFLKIVRENCTARVFEIAKSDAALGATTQLAKRASLSRGPQTRWKDFTASQNEPQSATA